jgi:predicted phage terminase large subunit-like protein
MPIRTDQAGITDDDLRKLLRLQRLDAVDHHLAFVKYTWNNPSEPYVKGRHIEEICTIIDTAIERFSQGISSFYIVNVPYRHGKSELISRKLPPHFLGLFPDHKVILAGHTSDMTEGYSREGRDLMYSQPYKEIFPGIMVDPKNSSGGHWKIHKQKGECFSSGLGGSMAGQGYSLGLLDDFCRNRADVESETTRERMWMAFTNDFMTRRAPVSITIILATRWHVDDIIGRIEKKMGEDPHFPRFEIVKFPAFSDDYPGGTLFPERFNKAWYEEQRATLGEYGTASLLQQNPTIRGGNMLQTGFIQRHQSLEEYPDIVYYRVWDLAHTAKERVKDDPDYTSGTLLGFRRKPGSKEWELWIKDVTRHRMNAPERDRMIVLTTEKDGPYVKVGVEDSVDSKDAFKTLRDLLLGKRIVLSALGRGDKVVRATPLEPLFEAGNVHIPAHAPWVQPWLDEIAAFPNGIHDDQVDNLSAGYILGIKQSGVIEAELRGT